MPWLVACSAAAACLDPRIVARAACIPLSGALAGRACGLVRPATPTPACCSLLTCQLFSRIQQPANSMQPQGLLAPISWPQAPHHLRC